MTNDLNREGMTRRDLLKSAAAMAGGLAADHFIGSPEPAQADENPTRIAPEQLLYDKAELLRKKAEKLHGDSVQIEILRGKRTGTTDCTRDLFYYLVSAKGLDRLEGQKGIYRLDPSEDEFSFFGSRWKSPISGREIVQVQDEKRAIFGPYPSEISETDLDILLKETPPADNWEIEPFMSYWQSSPRYSANFGAISAFIPFDKIPEERFIFVFSHDIEKHRWKYQNNSANAFKTTMSIGGKRFIFVSLPVMNPNIQEPDRKQINCDKIVMMITDITGRPVVQQTLTQSLYA